MSPSLPYVYVSIWCAVSLPSQFVGDIVSERSCISLYEQLCLGGCVSVVTDFYILSVLEKRIDVLMIKTKYTLQAYRGLDTGVPCADGSVQEPWEDLH